jgi:hypothetical protein
MREDAGRNTESTVFRTDESMYGAPRGRGRCVGMAGMICPMTLSDAGSFCSVLFTLPASQFRDERISERARIALPVCAAH